MPKNTKISLIGAGNIGGELAVAIARAELAQHVVLFDIPQKEGFAKGKALDLEQNSALEGYDCRITGTSDWKDCAGSDVLIVTAGIPRKPGQDRKDLIATNLPIIRNVADRAKEHCPNAFVIVISNPLDAMVYEFKRRTSWPKERIVGMAGVLDSARFQLFLARAANVSVKDVRAMVLGGHGDTMVPVLSACTINAIPATELIGKSELDAIIDRTRKGGGEIVGLMGTSAFYAPALSAVAMAAAYLNDQRRLLACAAFLEGEYGYEGFFMGVPCVIGARGIEKVVEITLSEAEKTGLAASAAAVKEIVEIVHATAS
ncbi:MAG: malate dehydrogenase [Myxococcales bacterium]|nr:malate dehydrogenase [Myxococcales bacterium]